MSAEVFRNEPDYYRWLDQNPTGFVVNSRRVPTPDYLVLHRATCRHIREPYRETESGGFTERDYIKVCANNLESLRDWAAANGRPDRSFSLECSHCRPGVGP
jgi:hypothetical protein